MASEPVFIFSLPRSGSTLLQRMLANHSDIQTQSELWFLLPHLDAIKGEYSRSVYSANSLGRATSAMLQQLPKGEESYYQAVKCLSDEMYNSIGGGVRYVVDKTPRYYFIIDEINKLYPDAKCIFLFRHPCSVAASLVESFYRNRLGDYRHRVDLYEGPKLLAEGYRKLKDKSLTIYYEDLVNQPEQALTQICSYLDIGYQDELINSFLDVPLVGLGDKFGSKDFKGVENKSIDKWKKIFNTSYRKKHLLEMLEYIGQEDIETFGYKFHEIIQEVKALPITNSWSLNDRLREVRSRIYSILEIPMLEYKYKNSREAHYKKKHYIHH